MADETRQAFEHPEARAAATPQGSTPPDRISLRDHVVAAEIGAFQSERGTAQRLRFDVVLEVRSGSPDDDADDDVDAVLSYDTLRDAIATELAAGRLNLLETLAERVAARILAEPPALRCFVRIHKLDRGPGALGVEIVRARTDTAPRAAADAPPRPLVVHLSGAAIGSPHLGGWLDQLETRAPVILTVGAIGATPRSPDAAAQRRIDLLAIEQAAWRLSGLDPRCAVVGTRTELDWSLRHGRTIVWAPSRMAVDAPARPAAEPVALTLWLAAELDARETLFIGEPEGAGPSVRWHPADAPVLP